MKTKQSKTTVKTAAMMVIAALVGVLSLADYATADLQWPYEYEDDFNTAPATGSEMKCTAPASTPATRATRWDVNRCPTAIASIWAPTAAPGRRARADATP